MRLLRLKAIAAKEMLQIWRDPRSLMVALLMPFMQMFLLGYGINLDIKHLPICVFDQDASPTSVDLLKRFQASPYFSIARVVQRYPQLTDAVDRGICRMAIVVPQDFAERLDDRGSASVQAILDGTDDNTANIALGYAQSVVGAFAGDVRLDWARRTGMTDVPLAPAVVQSRVWFNEDLESRNFIIPGVVAMVLALVGAQLTSLTIAREWERGTMELLVSTPVTPMEVMLGKLAPYFVIGMLDAAFCLSTAVFWFHVPFRGTLPALFLTTALFLIVVLGIGYMISVAIRNQIGASQIALLVTLLPTMLLSGFTFPIDQMPAVIRAITYLVHARYYVTIIKALFLKGSSLAELQGPMLALAAYAGVIAFFAARAFRKTLS